MKTLILSVLVGVLTAGCNYDTGECYPRDEQGAGSGGVITPGGQGGFGDVPPEPQDATNPADPCGPQTVECMVTWKAGSETCKSQGATGSCTTLYQGQHATLEEAKQKCEAAYGVGKSDAESCGSCKWEANTIADCKERCKKQCDKLHDRCHADCDKYDAKPNCRAECNNEYAGCLRECENDCK